MFNPGVLFEQFLNPSDVLVTMLAPAVGGRIGGIAYLEIRDAGLGVVDSAHGLASRSLISGTATTDRPPLARTQPVAPVRRMFINLDSHTLSLSEIEWDCSLATRSLWNNH